MENIIFYYAKKFPLDCFTMAMPTETKVIGQITCKESGDTPRREPTGKRNFSPSCFQIARWKG